MRRSAIIVTGAAGQLGRELLQSLAPLGEVHGIIRTPSQLPALANCTAIDLTDTVAIARLIEQVQPKLVVNAAAYTAVDDAESHIDDARKINVELPAALAEACKQCAAPLIHYSTDYVFDGRGERPWQEADAVSPLNAYGVTKAAGEQAVREVTPHHLIVRTSWVYGVQGRNFVKTMLRLGATKPELKVVRDQFGAPTSARVIADITAQMVSQANNDLGRWIETNAGTVHLTCAGETNWHAFAEEIFTMARALGFPLTLQACRPIATADYPTPARRPSNSRLDNRLLRDRFGLTPPHWQTALAQSIEQIVRVVQCDLTKQS